MSITVKVHGLQGIASELARWERRARGRALSSSLKAASKPIEEAMRSRIPRKGGKGSTGALHFSIATVTRTRRGSKGSVVSAVIGPASRMSRPRVDVTHTPGSVSVDMKTGNPIYKKAKTTTNAHRKKGALKGKVQVNTPTRYAHLVEFGFVHAKGKTRTVVRPRPFARPAWHSQGGQKAVDRFADALREKVLA